MSDPTKIVFSNILLIKIAIRAIIATTITMKTMMLIRVEVVSS